MFSVMGMGISYIYPVWREFIVVDHLVDTVLLLACQLRCVRVCSLMLLVGLVFVSMV